MPSRISTTFFLKMLLSNGLTFVVSSTVCKSLDFLVIKLIGIIDCYYLNMKDLEKKKKHLSLSIPRDCSGNEKVSFDMDIHIILIIKIIASGLLSFFFS